MERSAIAARPKKRESAATEAWGLMQEIFRPHRGRFFALARELDLAPGQMGALLNLEPGSPRPMSELAEALHCDSSNVTGLVDRLEDRGLVERRAAEHDRRVRMLDVTPEGERVREQIWERLREPPEALAALPAADQRQLRDLLRRVVDSR